MKASQTRTWRAALALTTALTFASLGGPAVHAQNFARPNLNIQARVPTINPAVTPRINPNVAGAVTGIGRTTPNLKTYQACSYAYRDSDGECLNKTGSSVDAGTGASGGSSGKASKGKNA